MTSRVIIFFSILLLFIIWLFFRKRIRYWVELLGERGWKSTVHYDRCLTVFDSLYADVNATALSLKERKEKEIIGDPSYTYGEVTFYSFVRIMEKTNPQPGESFYDLGSGGGKAVIIAGLVFYLKKACGIEKLDKLYELSENLLVKLENLPDRKKLLSHKKLNIQFIHDDFIHYDFSDGDIVFANATCFRGELFNQLINKLLKLKVGARVILGSADLDNVGGFKLLYENLHLMSWGLSTIRIYERI